MRKLLSRNSILALSILLFILGGCKAKQNIAVVKKETKQIEVVEDKGTRIVSKEEVIIHKPGTLNQKHLDSIKAVRKIQKRKIK